ncbi:MAG: hypothetical protein KDK66_04995 [Deltaproteobacteria bacterium]|nr:hypothetical protein [Deltaproteobacteria bacterium]
MKHLSLLLSLLFLLSACGGRIPSEAKTNRLSQKYFKSYGKKYQDSFLGQNPVQSSSVQGVQELQKNVATALVQLQLENQESVPVLITLIRKFPLGWRIKSWERKDQITSRLKNQNLIQEETSP